MESQAIFQAKSQAKIFQLNPATDPFITFLGFLSSALYNFFTGLSMAPWMLWMAAAVGSVRSMTSAVARSHDIS